MSQEDQIARVRQEEVNMKKASLRSLARQYSEAAVIETAAGYAPSKETDKMSEEHKKEIKQLYCEIFEVKESKEIPYIELADALKSDKLLERFAYRKRDRTGANDFVKMKGSKGQLDHDEEARKHVKEENDLVGFKCLHYSVTESNGHVEVTG